MEIVIARDIRKDMNKINVGHVFLHENKVYIKIKCAYEGHNVLCLDGVDQGRTKFLDQFSQCRQLDAKLTVYI